MSFPLTFIQQFWSAEDVCTVCTLDNEEKQLVSYNISVQQQFPSNPELFMSNKAFTTLLSFNIYRLIIEKRDLPEDQPIVH